MKTGARAAVLRDLLARVGHGPITDAPAVPRLTTLPSEYAGRIMHLFRSLGGTMPSPTLRPGSWDLACRDGVVVELDEELHFNRYRRITLQPDWMRSLPWRDRYLTFATEREAECLAATWGHRWTNASSESLFGVADARGQFIANGAPRWKQRALYDAMKDAAALADDRIRLIRLSTHDEVGGVRLGAVLERRASFDLNIFGELVSQRTS